MLLLDFLQYLPLAELFAATVFCGVIVGAVVLVSVRLTLRALKVDPKQVLPIRESLIGGLTGMFAIMVAFSAAGIWSDDIRAREAVQREANALENIVALASYLPEKLREEVRNQILLVGRRIIQEDWPAMQRRTGPNEPLFERLDTSPIVNLIDRLSSGAGGSATGPAFDMLIGQLMELRSARVLREMIARGGVSHAQWMALTLIPIAALTLIVLAYNHDFRWQLTAASIYIVAVCAALFVILAHDRPFVGYLGIKPIPIERAVERIRHGSVSQISGPEGKAAD
ncbi:MAG TPA: hypothetical protein VF014_00020 [Casimicrobiaceae bacterium]|nr:hypothetical protein [Casimicrobiaceae bacterium]